MNRRALIAVALTAVAGGATFALAQDPAPEAPQTWRTRPEVPGVARTLVPFGVEATSDGPRTWALGRGLGGKTVVLRRAPAGGWTADPLPAAGVPVGDRAPQHAGETAPDGRAAVLLADPADATADAELVTREPGGTFAVAPAAGAALRAGERLVPDATAATARTLFAVLGGEGADAGTLIAPTDADGAGSAVLHLGADGWTREPIDAPDVTTGPLRPVGLAAASGKLAWLLARSGDGLVLLQRRPVPAPGGGTGTTTAPTPPPGTDTTTAPTPPPNPADPADPAGPDDPTDTGTTPTPPPGPGTDPDPDPDPAPGPEPDPGGRGMHWVPADVAPHPLLGGEARPDGVSAVAVAAPPADPLTVTADGLWIDLRLTTGDAPPDHPADATVHLRVQDADGGAAARARLSVDGSWCDVAAARCDHPLGLRLPHGERGYRSLAFPAGPDAPFGGRIVSSPVDADAPVDAPRHDAQRQGGYVALRGERFVPRDGIGEDGSSTTQAIAFSADGRGFTGGTLAFGAAAPELRAEERLQTAEGLPAPVATAAASPEGEGTLLAFSRSGDAALYEPGKGWESANGRVDGLRSTGGEAGQWLYGTPPPVRALAWPRPRLLVAVGSAGLLTTGHVDPRTPSADARSEPDFHAEPLPQESTLLAVACTREGELECVTGGRAGLLLRGDAETWTTDRLPGDAAAAEITGVAYDGRVAVLATTAGLYRHAGQGRWTRDDDLGARMSAAGQGPGVRVVATEPGGGTVVDGLWERDAPDAPWRPTTAPLTTHPIAIAAVRDPDGRVRTLVTSTPDPTPLPTPLAPAREPVPAPGGGPGDPGAGEGDAEDEGGEPGGGGEAGNDTDVEESEEDIPIDPWPIDPVTLRETTDGWVDVDRASFQRSGGRDLPTTTVGTHVLAVDAAGTGWALGGVAGEEPDDPRQIPIVPTASFERLDRGLSAPPPPQEGQDRPSTGPEGEQPVPPGSVRLAFGGHPACLDRCTGGAGQGVTPDVHLERTVERVGELRRADAGPAALVVGGGRASVGGEPLDRAGARRYRELLEAGEVPTFALPGPGDLQGGGPQAFLSAFATAAAPVGTGAPPGGVSVDPGLRPPPGPGGAPTRFTFDVTTGAGTVRILAIDNAAGRLEGGPDGPQAAWIARVFDDARARSSPVVVVGSASIVAGSRAPLAADAEYELSLLGGRASAYVVTGGVDDPATGRFGGETARTLARSPGQDVPLPVLHSSALGYGFTYASYFNDRGEPDETEYLRQTVAAFVTVDVDVSRRDPATNVAPVTPRVELLLGPLQLRAPSRVALGMATQIGPSAVDEAQHRHLAPGPGDVLRAKTAVRPSSVPSNACAVWTGWCAGNIPDAVRFTSSDESVGRFVSATPGESSDYPRIVADAAGRPVDDPQLGVFCPVGLGTTTVTVRAMGRVVSTQVTVVPSGTLGSAVDVREPGRVPRGSCTFDLDQGRGPAEPTAAPEEAPAAPSPPAGPTTPGAVPAEPLGLPAPGPAVTASPSAPAPAPTPTAAPTPTPALPPPPPLAPVVPGPAADPTAPPVSPAAKATSPPAPPPPTGHAQVPQAGSAPQVQGQVQAQVQGQLQPAVRAAEQDRREQAFEGDHAAAAYGRPASPLPWEVGGAVAVLLLVAGGGVAAGRLRRGSAPAYERHRR